MGKFYFKSLVIGVSSLIMVSCADRNTDRMGYQDKTATFTVEQKEIFSIDAQTDFTVELVKLPSGGEYYCVQEKDSSVNGFKVVCYSGYNTSVLFKDTVACVKLCSEGEKKKVELILPLNAKIKKVELDSVINRGNSIVMDVEPCTLWSFN